MSKLPTQKKILREDLKDAPNWVNPLIDTINNFMELVYGALNGNITYSENISCFTREITYRTTSSYPVEENIEFTNTLKTKTTGVQVLQAFERQTYAPAPGPVYVPWVENNGSIVVSSITGLAANKTYTIRLLVT
jgi:hypothetical protein